MAGIGMGKGKGVAKKGIGAPKNPFAGGMKTGAGKAPGLKKPFTPKRKK